MLGNGQLDLSNALSVSAAARSRRAVAPNATRTNEMACVFVVIALRLIVRRLEAMATRRRVHHPLVRGAVRTRISYSAIECVD